MLFIGTKDPINRAIPESIVVWTMIFGMFFGGEVNVSTLAMKAEMQKTASHVVEM